MSGDYRSVQDALSRGTDPAMLCATCPWDRYCVSPPTMTRAEVDAQMAQAAAKDDAAITAAQVAGREAPMPTSTLLTALTMGARDLQAYVCPVFALRLRSSGGRRIADTTKDVMQKWDDAA